MLDQRDPRRIPPLSRSLKDPPSLTILEGSPSLSRSLKDPPYTQRMATSKELQRQNPHWFASRSYRITSSRYYDVIVNKAPPAEVFGSPMSAKKVPIWIAKQKTNNNKKKSANKITTTTSTTTTTNEWRERAIHYGIEYEDTALRTVGRYLDSLLEGKKLTGCGFYPHPTIPFLGASPDSVILDKDGRQIEYSVEVKCPYACRVTGKPPKYVLPEPKTGKCMLDPKCRYYYQVQGQMDVTGCNNCLFGVFTPHKTYIMYVERDQKFIDRINQQLSEYYVRAYYPYLLKQENIRIPQHIVNFVNSQMDNKE